MYHGVINNRNWIPAQRTAGMILAFVIPACPESAMLRLLTFILRSTTENGSGSDTTLSNLNHGLIVLFRLFQETI